MIENMYHTERMHNGKPIIIDIAEMGGHYEIAVLAKNGFELEMSTCYTIDEAEQIYTGYLQKYPESPAPLTGKYQKLADDLKTAIEAGKAAEVGIDDNSGSSNLDCVIIWLPRWNHEKIRQAAKESGLNPVISKCASRGIILDPITNGQGEKRTKNAEAMEKTLKNLGYSVDMWYISD